MSRTTRVSQALPAFVVLCCAAACLPGVLAAEPADGDPFGVKPAEGERASAVSVIKPETSSMRARVEAALLEPTPPLEFIDTPLNQVVEYIADARDISIILDKKSLIDAGIGTDSPVTANIRDAQLRTALKLVLRDHDLTYVFFDDVLLITTRDAALGMLETRVYPVGDLLTAGADAKTLATELNHLAEIVSTSLASSTWSGARGAGHVESLPTQRALVVSQTTEAHEKLEQVLAMIRKAQTPEDLASTQVDERDRELAEAYFKTHDRNSDRVLSVSEAGSIARDPSPIDQDGDGVVSLDELEAFITHGNQAADRSRKPDSP